jgi:hypothetical protein
MIKNLTPKLAEAGKIKIGGLGTMRKSKSGSEFRPPLKFDHFLVTKTSRNAAGDLEPDLDMMEAIGTDKDGKIRAIPIVFHSDEIDEVFPTSYALYSGKKCACRGDGETATRREMKDKQFTGVEKQIACPCPYLGAESGPVCKPNGKLYCSITAPGSAVAGAVHIWRTTSIISIEQMIGSLRQIKAVCGTLRGIPLWLLVKPITVEPKGSGPITVYCCHVELRAADIEALQRKALLAAETRAKLGCADDEYRRLLAPPGVGESEIEQAEIEAEFYTDPPEPADTTPAPEKGGADAKAVSKRLASRAKEADPGAPVTNGTTPDLPFGPAPGAVADQAGF